MPKCPTSGVRIDVWMRENVSHALKRLPEVQGRVFCVVFQESSHGTSHNAVIALGAVSIALTIVLSAQMDPSSSNLQASRRYRLGRARGVTLSWFALTDSCFGMPVGGPGPRYTRHASAVRAPIGGE